MNQEERKTRNSKPTFKQRRAVNNLVENGGIVSKAMRDAGYSPATAEDPRKLTESKGFQQLMEEAGLTHELIATSLVDDIKNKPRRRLGELKLGAAITGMIPKESPMAAIQINLGNDRADFQ